MKLRSIILLYCVATTTLLALAMALITKRMLLNSYENAVYLLNVSAIIVVALSAFNLWGAARHVLRPIEEITRFAHAFRANHCLQERLDLKGCAEMAQLGKQINQMIDEIQVSNQSLIAARERLQFDATHDPLTGVWNRSAALELLDREIARSEREGTRVAVLMLDLDHFKDVNDNYGHAGGDRVLQTIAASIGSILRTSDILARHGGEEFLVIAPSCTDTQAQCMAERIRLRLHSACIDLDGHAIRVTTSIGGVVASFPFSSEELIALADRALYQAKANGRNCVAWEDLSHTRIKGTLYSMPRRNV